VNDTLTVSQVDARPPRSRRARILIAVAKTVGAFGLAAVILRFILPHVVGVTYHDVLQNFWLVSPAQVAMLAALWIFGLWVHASVLMASLPGINRGQGMTLNLTGSAVANVLPLGGAAGISLNYYMVRKWGYSRHSFAAYQVVSNVVVVLSKLMLPVAAGVLLMTENLRLVHGLGPTMVLAAVLSAATLVLVSLALVNERAGQRGAELAARAFAGVRRMMRRETDVESVATNIMHTRDLVAQVFREQGARLIVVMTGYTASQAVLLWGCLFAVGWNASPAVIMAAFAVERFLTVVPITPAGVGPAEAGTSAVLVALGVPPTIAVAGVLLYRCFIVAAEVPVGGAWLLGWFGLDRLHGRTK